MHELQELIFRGITATDFSSSIEQLFSLQVLTYNAWKHGKSDRKQGCMGCVNTTTKTGTTDRSKIRYCNVQYIHSFTALYFRTQCSYLVILINLLIKCHGNRFAQRATAKREQTTNCENSFYSRLTLRLLEEFDCTLSHVGNMATKTFILQ